MSAAGRFSRWMAYEIGADIAQPYAAAYVDTAETLGSARDYLRDAYIGMEAIRQDGRRGGRMVSAGEWFHGASDRQSAVGQLSADFAAFQGDLGLHATEPSDVAWVIAVVVPTLHDWEVFAHKQEGSALAPWITEWSVFESWQLRLKSLRDLARSRGILLESPDPIPLPKTVWERADTGQGSSLDTWFGLLKTVIFGVIALTGLAGFYVIVKDVRGKVTVRD
jgi:hypothetical protein